MKIYKLDWDEENITHIAEHNVTKKEVVEVCSGKHFAHKTKNNRYLIYGRTKSGRYLLAVLTRLNNGFRVITARDMKPNERKLYNKKISSKYL